MQHAAGTEKEVILSFYTAARQQPKNFKLTKRSSMTSVIFRSVLVLDLLGRILESRHFCCSVGALRSEANSTFPGS